MSQDNTLLNFFESIDTDNVTSNIGNNQLLDSATSEFNITGGMSMNLSTTSQNSSIKLNKILDSSTINMEGGNNKLKGGNMDVDKLLSMLTSDSSSDLQSFNTNTNETSTESLENQLKQILNKNTTQQGGACVSCGSHIKNNDIKQFFTELKSQGVKVDVKLNNQSMTEYFNNALQTNTDINSQDGGANNKFSAAQSVRKDIAKEFNIPNGKDVVKIAFAVVKAVVEKTPALANDVDALSKAVKKHFEENKDHFKRML